MKKSLLLLFSLLIFVGNVWGDYTFTYPNQMDVGMATWPNATTASFPLGGTAQIIAYSCSLRTHNRFTDAKMYIGTSSGKSDLYEGNPGDYWSKDWIFVSLSVSKSLNTIHFTNNYTSAERHCKDFTITIATESRTLDDVVANSGNSSSNTFTFFYPNTSSHPKASDFECPDGFSISYKSGNTYCYTYTITFKPSQVKTYKGDIKYNGKIVATVIANGTPSVPHSLSANVTYTEANLSWDGVAGSWYKVYDNKGNELYRGQNKTFRWRKLDWGESYGFKVEACTQGYTICSAESGPYSVNTRVLYPPKKVAVSQPIGYDNATITWAAADSATSYKVFKNGNEVAEVTTLSYKFTGLDMNKTYSYKIESVLNGKATNTAETMQFTTQNLAIPTLEASNITYTSATLSWNGIEDAKGGYELITYDGKSVFFGKDVHSTTIDTLSIHGSFTYKIYSLLEDRTRSLDYGSATVKTIDLGVSTEFKLSNISYNSMDATWKPVTDAKGYLITERWTGMSFTFGADETSTTIYGLRPGTLYEFRLFATYNEVAATKNISAQGQTNKAVCQAQEINDYVFGCEKIKTCGFDWSDKIFNITTEKNAPILNFGYEIAQAATKDEDDWFTYGPYVRVEEYTNGEWTEVWRFTRSKTSWSGGVTLSTLKRDTRKVRIIYHGNLWCKLTNISIEQGSYFELNRSAINFGECYVGSEKIETLNVNYSSQAASVVSSETDLFTVSKSTVGSDKCGYGEESVDITANTGVKAGEYTAELGIGSKKLPISIKINALPAPDNFAIVESETTPTSIKLTWDDVVVEGTNETGYKVVCKQGDNVIGEPINVDADATECTVSGLKPNEDYTFVITTMYNDIENESKEVTGTTNQLPEPDNFALDAESVRAYSANFTWTEVPNASGYKLEWQWNENVDAETATVGNVSEYTITELKPNTKYSVKITTLYGEENDEHGTSDAVEVTTTCVVQATATGELPDSQLSTVSNTITKLTGTRLDDLSFIKGSTIKFTSSTENKNIKLVQLNVTVNGERTEYKDVSELELEVSGNIYIVSVYEYAGIAQVVDENGNKVYGTLTDAVNIAEEGAVINLFDNVEDQDMVVSNKSISFNGNGHQISNMYIKSDGSVDLIGDVVVVNDFGLEISTESSGQFTQTNAEIIVNGQAYIDKALDPSGVGNERCWYSVAVPFEVSYTDGIYAYINGDWKKVTFNKDFILKEYDGALRAASTTKLQGWVLPTTENIVPGKFYLMGLGYNGPNVFRFYKATGKDLITAENSIAINKYESSNDMNAGWNGIGNLKLFNVGIESAASGFAQVLQNGKFMTVELSSSKFAVTTPMFIQSSINTTADFSRKTNGTLRSVAASSGIYNLRISKENASDYSDQMFASASYETIGQYTIGRDLAKMEVSTGYPQIYTRAFNANLSVHEAQYNEKGVAEMPLYMYAPAAGNYTLNLGKEVYDGTSLLLVKDGVEIHNFNVDGAYTLYLAKGTNSSYSLQISNGEGGDIPTPVADATSNNKVHVYVSNGVLVIENLASGENYTVGNLIRTLHYGTSSGSKITIPLATKGVYWVKAGTTSVKVLNK